MKPVTALGIGRGIQMLGGPVLALASGVAIYLLLLEPPPITYTNLPFPVLELTVQAGEIVPLRIARCNTSTEKLIVSHTRTMENIARREFIPMASTITQVNPGCSESIAYGTRVPLDAPHGVYRFVGVAEVAGTLRTHRVTYYSEQFTVVEKTP